MRLLAWRWCLATTKNHCPGAAARQRTMRAGWPARRAGIGQRRRASQRPLPVRRRPPVRLGAKLTDRHLASKIHCVIIGDCAAWIETISDGRCLRDLMENLCALNESPLPRQANSYSSRESLRSKKVPTILIAEISTPSKSSRLLPKIASNDVFLFLRSHSLYCLASPANTQICFISFAPPPRI